MVVGICDDELYIREQMTILCREYLDRKGVEADIRLFSSGEEVRDYQGEMIHLLFLDMIY